MSRKKKNREEGGGQDIGVVMTCSLFLIILTFFILLNSIAVIDDRKTRLAIGSLIGSFGSLSGGLSKLKTGASLMPSDAPLLEATLNMDAFLKHMQTNMLDNLKVKQERGKASLTIYEAALFQAPTAVLKNGRNPLLDKLGQLINKGDYPVEIVAHTDNRPASRKGYASNWEMTGIMAAQVYQYLVEQGQVSPQRITAYGRGDREPAASNDTRESRRLNRRVEVVLKYDAGGSAKHVFEQRPSGNFTYKRFNFKVFKDE
jgi:chemotaxis protein MotB